LGESINLLDSWAAKPKIIIVYRGGWRPFFNRHLAEIGMRIKDIQAFSYQLIAISPDAAPQARESMSKNGLELSNLSQ